MSKKIFGKFPLTTILGAVVGGLMVLDEMLKSGETSWIKIGIAVAIAILGRVSADANNTAPKQKP